jgi:hypothetical protein
VFRTGEADLLRYKVGQEFLEHYDNGGQIKDRAASVLIYLTTPEGGETYFRKSTGEMSTLCWLVEQIQ